MSGIPFSKIQGTGNDFVLVEKKLFTNFSDTQKKTWIEKICARHFGVGAEGVVFFTEDKGSKVIDWVFYNPDGNLANFCGNAARACVQLFCNKWSVKGLTIQTPNMEIKGVLTGKGPTISFPLRSLELKPIEIDHEGETLKGQLIDTGVPHFVITVADLNVWTSKRSFLASLVKHAELGSQGCNITFLLKAANGNKTQTFERGVNDFTLSCGTGVIAAGISVLNSESGEVKLITPGGKLWVSCDATNNIVGLTGPTTKVFEGVWSEDGD